MPLIDLPLEELRRYNGRNPRPSDFDAFWDRALAELDAVDPQIELLPADFQTPFAECFHLWFTGVGGSRVHAKLLRPRHQSGPGPALLQFHGYTWHCGQWSEKLGYVANGFTVAALDCRGQGGLSEDLDPRRGNTHQGHIIRGLNDHEDRLYYRNVFLDTAQLARIVLDMPGVDANRVTAQGGSQGGGLTLACAALEPRIRRAAPEFPFLSDYLRVWEMDLAKDAYGELQSFFRFFDPRQERFDEIFVRLGYIDIQFLMPRVRAEILMGLGLMDTITPPSTCMAAYNKIESKKELVVYPHHGHEGLPDFADMAFQFLSEV